MDWAAIGPKAREFVAAVNSAFGDAWSSTRQTATLVADWLGLDLSAPTLVKHAILLALVWVLLWALGKIYRGEVQNQAVEVDLIENQRRGFGAKDILFTKETLDTKTPTIGASVTIRHVFILETDGRTIERRVRVRHGHFKLQQRYASPNLGHQQIAMESAVQAQIQNKAEVLARKEARKFDGSISRRLQRWLGRNPPSVNIVPRSYEMRVRFRDDIVFGPLFILFQHPDREVKATGWLTLLTSFFAVLAQLLFQSPATPASRGADAEVRGPSIVRAP